MKDPSLQPNAIVYSSPFVPPEWIASHGWIPSRRLPASGRETEGECRFASGFTALNGADLRAKIYATTCDAMRRAVENEADEEIPRFLFRVPATWQTPEVHLLYQNELKRLGHFLEQIGGKAPTSEELIRQMDRYEKMRGILLGRREFLSSRTHAEEAARFHASGELAEACVQNRVRPRGIPLLLLGAPLREDDMKLLELLDQSGGEVAFDATESGEREWPRSFDRRQMKEDPFSELSDAYFCHIPAIFRRPNQYFYEWLQTTLQREPVRGVLFVSHPWCDLWHAELPRIREVCPLPVLSIALAGDQSAEEAWMTRLQAFVEMLS